METLRLSAYIGPTPITEFEVSFCDSTGQNKLIREKMDATRLKAFLKTNSASPLLLAYFQESDDLGHFSFVDRGLIHRQDRSHRACGRYFLKQFVEDAVAHSMDGSGTFEVYPLKPSDVPNGWISQYYSRANSLFKSFTSKSLSEIGLRHSKRRDRYDDVYGTALPIYSYELVCGICLIKGL